MSKNKHDREFDSADLMSMIILAETLAEIIARDCIRQVTGFEGRIATESVLSSVGVVDDDAREAVNDEIVTNNDIGVRRFGFQLGPDDLKFTPSSKFFELRHEIAQNARPIKNAGEVTAQHFYFGPPGIGS